MIILALALLGFSQDEARAQTYDATGVAAPPEGASVRDPLLGFGAVHPVAPVLTIQGVATTDLLLRRSIDGAEVTYEPIVDDLFGAQLGALVPLHPRIAVGATLPAYFSSSGTAGGGLAGGDANVWVPVRIVGGPGVFDLSVVPFVSLPTGAADRYLGSPGPGGGALVSAGVDPGPLTAHLDVGADAFGATDAPEWPGGLHLRYAADVGVAAGDTFGAHLELRGRAAMSALDTIPAMLLGSVRFRPEERLWLGAGVGRGVLRGIGAPGLHMTFELTTMLGDREKAEAEVVQQRIATGPVAKEVHVVDSRRFPLHGARVTAGGTEVLTDYEGYAELPPRSVKDGQLTVTFEGFEPFVLTGISAEDPYWEVTLQRKPVPMSVSVVGPNGPLELVDVRVSGPAEVGAPVIDEAGVQTWKLAAGTWDVEMSSPGFGVQRRTILIEETRSEPIRVDAVLTELLDPDTKLRVSVVDALGRPVEDAVVALGDRDLGTTGTGGDLTIEGLANGEHALLVRSDVLGEAQVVKVVLKDGEQTVQAVLDWQPGSVQVRVSDPVGLPADATVTFVGPASLPSRTLGSDGEEVFVLRPGSWEVKVESKALGTQVRRVEVGDRPGELLTLDLVLRPDEDGPAELDLRVVDVDGAPLPGVAVKLDGKALGTTGPAGDLVLLHLDTGTRIVELAGDLLVPVTTELVLLPGRQVEEVPVWWVDGVVDLHVTGTDARPLDARVDLRGPSPFEALQVGRDGFERVVVPPGPWTFTFTSGELGVQARQLVVGESTRRRDVVRVQLAPVEPEVASLALEVVDETGAAVDDAVVKLDGVVVGRVSDGVLKAEGLSSGPVQVEVVREGMAPATFAVDLKGETAVQAPMAWAPGAVRVTVAGPEGAPVEAQVEFVGAKGTTPRSTVEGEATVGLAPGVYTVIASAPGLAPQEVEILVADAPGLMEVPIALEAPTAREHKVVLRAETPDGLPLAGAEVRVGGEVVGVTSKAGTVEVEGDRGELVAVEISPKDDYAPVTLEVAVEKGVAQHTVVLQHAPEAVEVTVARPDGAPVAASVTAVGPQAAAPVQVDGAAGTLQLTPGTWTVTARTADGAVATSEVVVKKNAAPDVRLVVDSVQSTVQADVIAPSKPMLFDLDSAEIRADAKPLLDDLARWLRSNQNAALIEIAGHTDDRGGVAYNQQLSERRALAVKQALVARGVPPERLVARGYGLSRPASAATDPVSRQKNRRVEVVVRQWVGEQPPK